MLIGGTCPTMADSCLKRPDMDLYLILIRVNWCNSCLKKRRDTNYTILLGFINGSTSCQSMEPVSIFAYSCLKEPSRLREKHLTKFICYLSLCDFASSREIHEAMCFKEYLLDLLVI